MHLEHRPTNLANAGAIGIVFYMSDSSATFSPTVEDDSGNLPIAGGVVMISLSDGTNLKNYIDAHPGAAVIIDPERNRTKPDRLQHLLGIFAGAWLPTNWRVIAPPGRLRGCPSSPISWPPADSTEMSRRSTIAECISPLSPTIREANCTANRIRRGRRHQLRRANRSGRSRSGETGAPHIHRRADSVGIDQYCFAGYERRRPGIYAQRQVSFGAGRLDANAAVNATVTVSPVIHFFWCAFRIAPRRDAGDDHQWRGRFRNFDNRRRRASGARGNAVTGISVNVDQTSLTVPPAATATFNVSLSGAIPAAGQYSGNITVQGTGVSLHIPYLFIVSSTWFTICSASSTGHIYNPYDYACFTASQARTSARTNASRSSSSMRTVRP